MTKKEKEIITINICRTAEFIAHYKLINKEKADLLTTQLLAKINLSCALGLDFNCYDLVLNENDVQRNPLYKSFKPGLYIEIVRGDGFRHLAPVRKKEEVNSHD